MRTEIEVALYRHRDPEEYRATLGHLHEETVRMTNLVDNLLSLARADGGADTITLVPIPVNKLLCQMQDRWKRAMEQSMLDFHMVTTEDDLALLGDVHAIPRLLSILLDNASKYTPPGGFVKLCAEVAGTNILLSVCDSGMGIGPEHRRHIFDRFYRATPAGIPVSAGSGLGLSLAQWIAERHGTEVSVESALGRGSCFSFFLKKADPDCPDITSLNSEHFQLASRPKEALRRVLIS
jgi:signal transduction histidine kinase